MTDRPISVGLHVGAHKTATTHLQRSISAADDALQAEGTRFHGPRSFRWGQRTLLQRFGIGNGPDDTPPQADPDALATLGGGAKRLVMSEENVLGTFLNRNHRARRPLYPDAVRRLTLLAGHMPQEGFDLYLGVRDPAAILTSAYSQLFRAGHRLPPAEFVARNPIALIDWSDLAGRLAGVPGVRSVTVWRHEEYRSLFDAICLTMVGTLVEPLKGDWHPGLSAHAIEAALKMPTRDIDALASQFPKGAEFPGLALFEDEAQAVSDEFYAAQWDAMAKIPGVILLQATGS